MNDLWATGQDFDIGHVLVSDCSLVAVQVVITSHDWVGFGCVLVNNLRYVESNNLGNPSAIVWRWLGFLKAYQFIEIKTPNKVQKLWLAHRRGMICAIRYHATQDSQKYCPVFHRSKPSSDDNRWFPRLTVNYWSSNHLLMVFKFTDGIRVGKGNSVDVNYGIHFDII